MKLLEIVNMMETESGLSIKEQLAEELHKPVIK